MNVDICLMCSKIKEYWKEHGETAVTFSRNYDKAIEKEKTGIWQRKLL